MSFLKWQPTYNTVILTTLINQLNHSLPVQPLRQTSVHFAPALEFMRHTGGWLHGKVTAAHTQTHRSSAEDSFEALRIIGQLGTDYLPLMETAITNKAMDPSQTGISGEGCWDLWQRGVSLSPSVAWAISESKCSSFIYYSIRFTPVFLFLFPHTPFSPSPPAGDVFIFGVFLFLFPWQGRTSTAAQSPCCGIQLFLKSVLQAQRKYGNRYDNYNN